MVDVAGARVVAVLTRAPSSGGKTRLFEALGCAPDPRLLTALLLDTVDGTAAPGVSRVVAVTPASGCGEVASLVPPDVDVLPQLSGSSDGTLGERMRRTCASLLDKGSRAVVLIGSDLPAMTPAIVETAFEILDRDPDALVLGPAADGGYYLIGATRVPPVFDGIEWGSDAVLAQTTTAATLAGLRVSLLDALTDVDTLGDLQQVARERPASRTAAWVRDGRYDSRYRHGAMDSRPLVLIVEDDLSTRVMYRDYLSQSGFRTADAHNGFQALEKAQSLRPDAILTDLAVPGMDGFEFCRALQEAEPAQTIPIIAVTGHSKYLEQTDRLRRSGIRRVLMKPCELDLIVQELRNLLNGSVRAR